MLKTGGHVDMLLHPPLALLLAGGHHHLAELVEVHGPAPVLVNLGDNPVQVLLGQVGVHLRHDGPELGHGDETLTQWSYYYYLYITISDVKFKGRKAAP